MQDLFSVFKGSAAALSHETIRVVWESSSNIALVKYWGKRSGQLPANPSLSMTLSRAYTRTAAEVRKTSGAAELVSLNGNPQHPFLLKLRPFFQWLTQQMPVLEGYSCSITTENSFPHSTGIASSASGISAFTLCMIDVASQIAGINMSDKHLLQLASFAARMGSGSACRSLYGGFSAWGESRALTGSSDLFAIPINDMVHPDMARLHDAILVVSSKPKSVASSLGHTLMNQHPFAPVRFAQAGEHITEALQALKSGDFELLGEIAENEALTLHSFIMTSPGGNLLFEPESIAILKKIRLARSSGLPLFYTLDAGPNVHLLYPPDAAVNVESFINTELLPFCEEGKVIFDKRGEGPQKITTQHQTKPIEGAHLI
jgi:diphosphomevalonate decarboxylase